MRDLVSISSLSLKTCFRRAIVHPVRRFTMATFLVVGMFPAASAFAQSVVAPAKTPVAETSLSRLGTPEWIRKELDGSGVGLVVRSTDYLLVIDPNRHSIARYLLSDIGSGGAKARTCTFDSDFSPRRSASAQHRLVLVGEREERADRSTAERSIELSDDWVAAMPETPTLCPKPVQHQPSSDFAPATLRSPGLSGRVSILSPVDGRRLSINPFARGYILGERVIGILAGGRVAVLSKELDLWPKQGVPIQGAEGRVIVNTFVTIFSASGTPEQKIRIADFRLTGDVSPWAQAGATPAQAGRNLVGLGKRGFEYLIAATVSGRDGLYIVRSVDSDTSVRKEDGFQLELYPIPFAEHVAGLVASHRWDHVVLLYDGTAPEPAQDGEPAQASDLGLAPAPITAPMPDAISRLARKQREDAWRHLLLQRVTEFSAHVWTVPPTADSRPCSDRCVLKALRSPDGLSLVQRAEGVPLLTGELAVQQDGDGDLALWVGPRQLVGAHGPQVGVPYSFGGTDTAVGFEEGLARYAGQKDAFPPPIGHIREYLSVGKDKPDYPLGVDCSAFVAAIFYPQKPPVPGERHAVTDARQTSLIVPNEAGKVMGAPLNAFARPVEHPSQLKPGDMLVKHGHIVIFMGTEWIGRRPGDQTVLGYIVYEAGSRCGRVCRSVYEPDFFNGWWMFRPESLPVDHGPAMPNPYGEPAWVNGPPVRRAG
ncbi:MAG: hypothetical protein JWR80_6026 [Bradyrhizobium sp.]|nr:hypothetical protein [Bradyrhizobium sp.]